MIRIGFNPGAMNALRHMRSSSVQAAQSMERMASGKRINSAQDDPAGLAISMRMRGQISGLEIAGRNMGIGQNMVQVGESALGDAQGIMQRVRDLAVEWNSGTATDSDKAAIQAEVVELEAALGSIGGGTVFNGISLLDNAGTVATLQVGANAGDTLDISGVDLATELGTSVSDFSAAAPGATIDIAAIDDAINNLSTARAQFGAVSNRLDYAMSGAENQMYALMEAESRITDTDIAAESVRLASAQIRQDASMAMLAQANMMSRNVLALFN